MKPSLPTRLVPLVALALVIVVMRSAAADDTSQQVLEQMADAYENAWWARLLGWVAVALGAFNLIALAFMVRGLARRGWSLLGQAEWPILAIRRRQAALRRSLGELNAHFQDLDADRPRMNDMVKSAADQLRAAQEAKQGPDAGG
ncbi:MAG TPA: hypothetical protein VEK12_18335 [Alphaproteobacteria bacterium]|nr:hypothetical protein [Alphaproteobacteria bacterium]